MSSEYFFHIPAEATEGNAVPQPEILDQASHAAAIAGIQRGLQSMYAGTGENANSAFALFEHQLGILENEHGP